MEGYGPKVGPYPPKSEAMCRRTKALGHLIGSFGAWWHSVLKGMWCNRASMDTSRTTHSDPPVPVFSKNTMVAEFVMPPRNAAMMLCEPEAVIGPTAKSTRSC
jgi:hypothetical protein